MGTDYPFPWSSILVLPLSVLQDGFGAFYSSSPRRGERRKRWYHQCVARRTNVNPAVQNMLLAPRWGVDQAR